jgi:tetratricopeptide (TPR) repeat protein
MISQRILALICLMLLAQGAHTQAKKAAPKAEAAPGAEDLILAGKTQEAIRLTSKIPAKANEAIKNLAAKADMQVTDRKIAEAEQTLKSASEFGKAYTKIVKGAKLQLDPILGRQMRIEGIKLNDSKEYAKAEAKLQEALKLSQQIPDAGLECGIHNNLGYAIEFQGRIEDAAKEYDRARLMAETQKDMWRAASYNFNLGRMYIALKKFEEALNVFRRMSEQAQAAGKDDLLARSYHWQGVSLGKINLVSSDAVPFFDKAAKLFIKLGDSGNAGRTLLQMGDHKAYSQDFDGAAKVVEQAVPYIVQADDKQSLLQCYGFLQDMYAKLKNTEKAAKYQKLVNELLPQLRKKPTR